MRNSVFLLLALASCGAAASKGNVPSPKAEPSPARSSSPTPVPATPSGSTETLGNAPAFPPVEFPTPVVCTLRDSLWIHTPVDLRFRADSAPFAKLYSAKDVAILFLAGERTQGAIFDADARGLRVRGAIQASDIHLHASRARAVSNVLVPFSSLELSWEGADATAMRAAMPVDRHIKLLGARQEFSGPCNDFALDSTYDPLDALGGPGIDEPMAFAPKRLLGVAAAPGGPTIAQVIVDSEHDAGVTVVEKSGAHSRIAWFGADQALMGWVANASLVRGKGTSRPGTGSSRSGSIPKASLPSVIPFVCPQEVLLIAEQGGERRTVGRIAPQTKIEVSTNPVGALSEVDLPQSFLRPEPGASFLVRTADLKGCARTDGT